MSRVLALVLTTLAGRASAEGPSVDGTWTMTPLTETFTVQQWGTACGAAPSSGVLSPGGPVEVRTDGREITVQLARRTLRSDQCVDPMPTLLRAAHTVDATSWRTRCGTAPEDSRQAFLNSAFFLAADGAISIAETGRYETVLQGSRCVIDVSRQASLRRVPTASAAPSATPAPTASAQEPSASSAAGSASPPKVDCSSPGAPARLEVRPSRKLLRFGEDFAFRALVVDADGCRTSTPVHWSLGPAHAADGRAAPTEASIDGAGNIAIAPDASTEATFDVVATVAGRSARASVQVASSARFDALLVQSGLDERGERESPAIASLATSSVGTSNVVAEDGAKKRRNLFLSIIGLLVLALGGVAMVGARRTARARALERAARARHAEQMAEYERQKRYREEQHAREMRAHLDSVALAQQVAAEAAARGKALAGPRFCPSCHREFSSATEYCPFDSNRLVPVAGHEAMVAGPAGSVCPTCRRGFNPGVRVCPNDGDELVPPALLPPQAPAARGKICPTCGDRFDGAAAFCGKDGTQLVLLN